MDKNDGIINKFCSYISGFKKLERYHEEISNAIKNSEVASKIIENRRKIAEGLKISHEDMIKTAQNGLNELRENGDNQNLTIWDIQTWQDLVNIGIRIRINDYKKFLYDFLIK